MQIKLNSTQLYLRNSRTRIPFRYGSACLTRCPQAVLAAELEIDGKRQVGYAGDCFPPSWFDKSPSKSYAAQIDDMITVTRFAEQTAAEEFASPTTFFSGWLLMHQRVQTRCADEQLTCLLASFGVSMIERAMMDAICRHAQVSFAVALKENLFGIVAGEVHPELAELEPKDWIAKEPMSSIYVRHTVGLGDPLTLAEVPSEELLNDGSPQALQQYLAETGLRYFKLKVSNQLEADLERLLQIARLIERSRGEDYAVTIDGNEQYRTATEFDELIEAICADTRLATLWKNTLVVEQPLERSIALSAEHTLGIQQLSKSKPVIIDESDGRLDSFRLARELGYRGVSSKSCKGPIKSVLNAGLIWHGNQSEPEKWVMTGEDLCCVGIIPVQSDLALVATLGLEHVERNGHHYHPGISYLPDQQQQAALTAHADFYVERGGKVVPKLVHGRFEIGSLQCVGFGFAVEPDLSALQPASQWQYHSLETT